MPRMVRVSGRSWPESILRRIVGVDVDDVGHGVEVQAPDLFDDGGARYWLAGVAHQKFQQGRFLGTPFDGTAVTLHGVGDAIEFEIFYAEKDADGAVAAAQDRANTRGKFGEGNGLAR